MKQEIKNFFTAVFKMETQTVYNENGRIVVTPLDYELGQCITLDGKVVKIPGRVVVDSDGNMTFTPSKQTMCSRFNVIYRTRYAEIRETKRDFVFVFRFQKMLMRKTLIRIFIDEIEKVKKFVIHNIN